MQASGGGPGRIPTDKERSPAASRPSRVNSLFKRVPSKIVPT